MSASQVSPGRCDRIRIFDTTLRDGEQAAGVCFHAEDKVEIARRLDALHVDVIEAGFPASSRVEAEAVAAVAQAVKDARVCALARAVPGDVEAALAALRSAVAPRIHLFVNSSDMHLAHQLHRTHEQVMAMTEALVGQARRHCDDVEFSPMDATRADPAFLAALVGVAIAAGAGTINLPDTVGAATPDQVAQMFRGLRAAQPKVEEIVLSFHGHDDLGMATGNSLAAVMAGARQVEVSVNGLGERAGNTAFEEFVAALYVHGQRLGVATGVEGSGIYALAKQVAERSGVFVPPNKAVVGGNAFRHASGIHQDGVLKHRETYEVLDPQWIGHPVGSEIVLGKLSGRTGFARRVAELGFALEGEALAEAFRRFQALAAERREVGREELSALCAGVVGAGSRAGAAGCRAPGYSLDL